MGRAPIEIVATSALATDRATVWATVSTMAGVNAELGPFVRMTHPAEIDALRPDDVVAGEVLFVSWLLAFGVVPFDRHRLVLEQIDEGAGFVEASSSWLQRSWGHERRLVDLPGGGCEVTDRLTFVPRVRFAGPVVRAVIAALFGHRHRRLRRRFGAA